VVAAFATCCVAKELVPSQPRFLGEQGGLLQAEKGSCRVVSRGNELRGCTGGNRCSKLLFSGVAGFFGFSVSPVENWIRFRFFLSLAKRMLGIKAVECKRD